MIRGTTKRIVFLAAALLLATLAGRAHAAGLGPLNVKSALGEPLNAEAEILALGPKDFDFVAVKLASVEAHKDAKILMTAAVRQIRFEPVKRADGSAFLRMTSNNPMNEPSLQVYVEFTWPNGRLLQKYSILLDPQK